MSLSGNVKSLARGLVVHLLVSACFPVCRAVVKLSAIVVDSATGTSLSLSVSVGA